MAWIKYAAQVEITIRELAEELGVPVESLYKYSAKEKWREKRRQYTERMLAETRKQLKQETEQVIARSEDSREKSREILKFLRDGLTKAWQVALAHMVMPKDGTSSCGSSTKLRKRLRTSSRRWSSWKADRPRGRRAHSGLRERLGSD